MGGTVRGSRVGVVQWDWYSGTGTVGMIQWSWYNVHGDELERISRGY